MLINTTNCGPGLSHFWKEGILRNRMTDRNSNKARLYNSCRTQLRLPSFIYCHLAYLLVLKSTCSDAGWRKEYLTNNSLLLVDEAVSLADNSGDGNLNRQKIKGKWSVKVHLNPILFLICFLFFAKKNLRTCSKSIVPLFVLFCQMLTFYRLQNVRKSKRKRVRRNWLVAN